MNKSSVSELKKKNILVLGLGISGSSAIKKIFKYSGSLTAMDNDPLIDIDPAIREFANKSADRFKLILGNDENTGVGLLNDMDLVIISPGVSSKNPIIRKADALKIPVWSEIELGWFLMEEYDRGKTIAVTGTNGKTTVVTILQKILSDSGLKAVSCGNIGNPLINTIHDSEPERLIRVIEISSFQLERIVSFNPKIGILLNITSDHLDRHGSMESYGETKFRLFLNANKGNWGIFNIEDEYIGNRLDNGFFQKTGPNIIRYSIHQNGGADIYLKNNSIHYTILKRTGAIDISGARLIGKHNILNLMAAVAAAKILGLEDEKIKNSIASLIPLEHRIEYIGKVLGIDVYNDSKSTNPDSTIKALESFDVPVTLIMGGKDKDMDFSSVIPYMIKKVSGLILIGETRKKIKETIKEYNEVRGKTRFTVFTCDSLEEAVELSFNISKKGTIILLSPACASFDMFRDYKDRGRRFKKLVENRMI